jgi:hypothetical protein
VTDAVSARTLARTQGAYFLATGIWPLVDRHTFEKVTGPKIDFWLARTVGVLVACIGGALLVAAERDRLTVEMRALGAGSAAGLAVIDLVYVLRRRIPLVYLADAVVEVALTARWVGTTRNARSGSRSEARSG